MNFNLKKTFQLTAFILAGLLVNLVLKSCTQVSGMKTTYRFKNIDTPLTEANKRLVTNALRGLSIFPGLKVEVMATEPTLINPTNIDVDEKGRVWVTEAYNYRFEINSNKPRPEGDRILILEDKDGDGQLETSKVFYQGPEINAPLGICVLKDRVIVSQSPYIWQFFDDNNDGRADRKEILFQGIGGNQHDHGAHSFTSGPDGKLYFNLGNEGRTLKDKNNRPVLDQDGDEIGPNKYREGMLFRCNMDGTQVECLGSNFRNPYEAAIDSYGTIWQSDNDDDGNRGTRINYVMQHGNFGYKDEMTGATWNTDRINIESAIPLRHWHQNDPGVVPNLLQTGSGSPAGIVFYEGSLLPPVLKNQLIHAEPGHNVVHNYPVKSNGAGYSALSENVLSGDRDQWFRPVDVCVAPDGSLIVADWYDPGVGGHRVGDLQRGRIYRITPAGYTGYKMPVVNFDTADGATSALKNPNLAVRRIAYTALTSMGDKAIKSLVKLWHDRGDPPMRARALWVLAKSKNADKYLSEAISDPDPNIRITGLRAAKSESLNVIKYITMLVKDNDIQVRRECALTLRHSSAPEAPALWALLAAKNDGTDRWYLEALGMGADRQWAGFFAAYLTMVPDPLLTEGSRDIVWRARTDEALPYLVKLASDPKLPVSTRLKYFRAFDFYNGEKKSKALIGLLAANNNKDAKVNALVLKLLDAKDTVSFPVVQQTVREVLKSYGNSGEYLSVVRKFNVKSESSRLIDLIAKSPIDSGGIRTDAARLIFQFKEAHRFSDVITEKNGARTANVLTALSRVGNRESLKILSDVVFSSDQDRATRKLAIEMMGKSTIGETQVLDLLKNKKLSDDMIAPAVSGLSGTRTPGVLTAAKAFLPNASNIGAKQPATISQAEILGLAGNMAKGKAVFLRTCMVCHQAASIGFNFGPNLSEIGAKLPKEGLFDAIVNPSAGISFGYETSQLDMQDGARIMGILSSRTETDIEVKFPGGTVQKMKTADVKKIQQLQGSMMPNGLAETMTKQEFADLLEFLTSLKKKP
jgi:putative membrane-bound dehydrogenase-like protein